MNETEGKNPLLIHKETNYVVIFPKFLFKISLFHIFTEN